MLSARNLIFGMSACAIWAVANILTKFLLDKGIPPLTLLAGQLLMSTPALWLVVLLGRRRLAGSHGIKMTLLGIVQPGLAYGLAILGLELTSATLEALLFAAEPLLIVFLAWPFLGERPERLTVLSALVGAGGVVLISVGNQSETAQFSGFLGPILILSGVLAAAIYAVLLRPLAAQGDPIVMIAASQSGGLAFVIVVWLFWPVAQPYAGINLHSIPLIGLSGIFLHALSFVLFAYLLQAVPVGVASLFLLTIPVMTAGLAALFLNETMTNLQWLGAAIVLLSSFALTRRYNA